MKFQQLILPLAIVALLTGVGHSATVVGPAKGSLVIVGGNIQDLSILRRFIDLAGGPEVPIVVIPTAGGAPDYDQYWSGLKIFREAGAKNLTVLHTYDRRPRSAERSPTRKNSLNRCAALAACFSGKAGSGGWRIRT